MDHFKLHTIFCYLANILTKNASVIASSLRNASNLNWGSIWTAKFKFDVPIYATLTIVYDFVNFSSNYAGGS